MRSFQWVTIKTSIATLLGRCPPPTAEPPGKPELSKTSASAALPDNASHGENAADFVTVPPGHKIVVVHASELGAIGRAESGVWIAQMGKHELNQQLLDSIKKLASQIDKAVLIWIVAPEFIEALSDQKAFLSEFAAIVEASKGRVGHSAVFPHALLEHEIFIQRVRALGIAVHGSADDGACFVEVHRPDGIVVGMPGREYK